MRNGIVSPGSSRQTAFRAALSVTALAAMVVAIPVVLFSVGGAPLSHLGLGHVTGLFDVRRSYSSHFVAHWLERAALTLAWISWLWMTTCVFVEIRSWLTGRAVSPLPASRTMQSIAACLVGTTLAFSSLGRSASISGRPAPRASAAAAAVPSFRAIDDVIPLSQLLESSRSLAAATEVPAPSGPDATQAHSSAHRGSRRSLPDDAVVDGSTVDDEHGDPPRTDSLELVSPHPDSPRLDSFALRRTGRSHLVRARETLWSIASDRLGSSLRWREIAELNYHVRQSDGGALTEEHWMRPGWTLELPPLVDRRSTTPDRAPTCPSVSPLGPRLAPVHPVDLGRIDGVDLSDGDQWRGGSGSGQPAAPIVPFGAGVVGAGVVSLLDRMRRVQQRHRRGGSFIKLPPLAQRSFEQRLRVSEGFGIGLDVDSAIRRLVEEWDESAVPPAIKGVRVGPDVIDLIVDGRGGVSTERSSGSFAADLDGRTYRIHRSALSDAADPAAPLHPGGRTCRTSVPPAPLMVTAGHAAGGLIMVNLESLGTLVVEGDPIGCEGVMRALALELATSYWAGAFDLVLAGFGAELERFDRVLSASDTPALMDQVCRRRLSAAQLLQSTGFHSFAQARCVEGSKRWDPLVVICGPTMAEADVGELVTVADDPRLGIAAVAAGGTAGAAHVLSLSGSGHASSLDLLRSVITPQRVEADELDELASLVETASSRQSVLRSDEPYVSLPIPVPVTAVAESAAPDRSTPAARPTAEVAVRGPSGENIEVEVSVLGQIEIRGAAREFTRAWAIELVVYLAMHPKGASNEAWATALWPDRLMAPSSLHSTASVARRSLGQARSGIDHLPRSHGRLALSSTVGTDWGRFVELADSDDTGRWRSALDLVRGMPFDGLRSADWVILEGIGPAIEAAVVDLSGRLAGACLSRGDARGAQWAARQGLLVSPYDERLYRMLMRAADLGGNPAGVESAMSELVRLVADDIEPLDSVHPSTVELYRSLTRRRTGGTGLR